MIDIAVLMLYLFQFLSFTLESPIGYKISVFWSFDSQHSEYTQEFHYFYKVALALLDRFYPERTMTVRSRDPGYITQHIKKKEENIVHPQKESLLGMTRYQPLLIQIGRIMQ